MLNIDTSIARVSRTHFVGIGGSGMSALAMLFLSRGILVSGSDAGESEMIATLRAQGSTISIGHAGENIPDNIDLLVYSSAVPEDNVERTMARKRKVLEVSYAEALGMVMSDYRRAIAVSGTNGKTTTTSLLGIILTEARLDPTVIVGGVVPSFGGNFRSGGGETFVVEGCEYRRNMLSLSPNMIVLTNIEEDHLDYYKDLGDIIDAFIEYVTRLSKNDVLIANADDMNVTTVAQKSVATRVSYGIKDATADLLAKNVHADEHGQTFSLYWRGRDLGIFTTSLPGTFNIYNILAASVMALHLGVEVDVLRRAVSMFTGAARRFERHVRADGKIIISDYAHHPTALAGAISATKSAYPGKRLLVVFQPHQKDRTIKLFNKFVDALAGDTETVLVEIYEVAGRNEAQKEISSRDLIEAVKKQKPDQNIFFAASVSAATDMVAEKLVDFDVVLIMGAGDVYKIAKTLT